MRIHAPMYLIPELQKLPCAKPPYTYVHVHGELFVMKDFPKVLEWLSPSTPQELVLEKETRIRESMLMMGLQLWVLWTTWFIKQFVFLFITSVVMALLLKVHFICVLKVESHPGK